MESGLTLQKKDYDAKIGNFLGYGRGALFSEATWTTEQQNDIDDVRQGGERNVYTPKLSGGQSYAWSFLRPVRQVIVQQGKQFVILPDDFAGFDEEKVTVTLAGSSNIYRVIRPTNHEAIRIAYSQFPTDTGQPIMVATQFVEGTRHDGSNRQQLWVYPAADQDYTLSFPCYLRPLPMSADQPFPYGGPELSELFLESMLAVAEIRRDDMIGIHNAQYQDMLAAAISNDRIKRPQHLGRYTDRSDLYDRQGWGVWRRDYQQFLDLTGTIDTSLLVGGS